VCVVVSHAWPTGQSVALLHPQAPETQACPAAADVQSTQLSPGVPQVEALVLVPGVRAVVGDSGLVAVDGDRGGPGQPAGTPPGTAPGPTPTPGAGPSGQQTSTAPPGVSMKDYAGGPFVGVRPSKKGISLLELNGATKYEEWTYTVNDYRNDRAALWAAEARIWQ